MLPEERYRRDVAFSTLVDMLEHFIHEAQYTPTELREAVILAAIHYEVRKPREPFWVRPDAEQLQRFLNEVPKK